LKGAREQSLYPSVVPYLGIAVDRGVVPDETALRRRGFRKIPNNRNLEDALPLDAAVEEAIVFAWPDPMPGETGNW
jgi:hypothetical protein